MNEVVSKLRSGASIDIGRCYRSPISSPSLRSMKDLSKDSASIVEPVPLQSRASFEEANAREDSKRPEVMDGGIDAWRTVAGGWLAMTATFGYQNAYGVYQDFYGREHTASSSAISWIGSTQLFLLTSLGLFTGKFVDMGFFRQTLLTGSSIYVFSLFMLSIAHPSKYYQIFLSQGIGMGLGSGFIYIPCLAVQSHHWASRRALALGIVFTGSSVGGIVFPIMLNNLLNQGVGFPWAVRASAFLVLGMLTLSNYLMLPRPELTRNNSNHKANFKAFFTDVPYMLLILGASLCLAGIFFPWFYVQVYADTHGVNSTVSFYTLAILNVSSIPGRVLPNFLVHSCGLFNILLLSGISSSAVTFALFGCTNTTGIIIFAILAGFLSGAFLSLLAAATASLAAYPSEVGLRMGLAFAMAAVGSLVGAPIDGALLGNQFRWHKTIIFSGAAIVTGTFILAISRHFLVKRKRTSII